MQITNESRNQRKLKEELKSKIESIEKLKLEAKSVPI